MTPYEEWAVKSSRDAKRALVFVILWTAFAVVASLFLAGCTSTADVQKPAPLYGPGGYAERMHVQRAPYSCRRP